MSISFYFDTPTDANVTSTKLYESATIGGTFTNVETYLYPSGVTWDATRSQYYLTYASGQNAYYYYITFVNAVGLESAPSAIETGTGQTVAGDAYITIAEAQDFMNSRLDAEPWDDSTVTNQSKALVMATRAIDTLNYEGDMYDDDQTLQFPRGTDTTVPQDIKDACAEEALALLDGKNPDLEFENLGMVSQGYSSARATYDRTRLPEHLVAGIASSTAWRYLKPYIRDANTIDLSRVS